MTRRPNPIALEHYTDIDRYIIACNGPEDIVQCASRVVVQLHQDIENTFNTIKLVILAKYGEIGLYDRLNGKTVASILAEYGGLVEAHLMESGEVDGVRYELHDAQ